MRFLIINTDYTDFLHWFYTQHPGLEHQPYEEQMRVRNEGLFGVADFYSRNLRNLGNEAWNIHANNEFMQKAWAREHGIHVEEPTPAEQRARTVLQRARRIAAKTPLRYLKPLFRPVLRSLDSQQTWFHDILAAQIKHYKPDVLLNQAMPGISSRFLKGMKPCTRLLIGQHAATLVGQHAATRLSEAEDFSCYDLVVSSFPPTVDYFRQKGILAELHRLGFEPRVLSCLQVADKIFDVTFIGSFHRVPSSRVAFLEVLCAQLPQIKIWGPKVDHLPVNSLVRKHYVGQAWARQMYQILRNSKITLNHHGDIPPYANNCRLYEATGVGTLLITDWKVNLHKMFGPSKEVVTYRSSEECVELIQYYLEHDDERETIARAGQQRTLHEHTYYHRMQELVDIVRKYL